MRRFLFGVLLGVLTPLVTFVVWARWYGARTPQRMAERSMDRELKRFYREQARGQRMAEALGDYHA